MPDDMRKRGKRGIYQTHFRWPGIEGYINISLGTSDPVLAKARLEDIRAELRRGVDPRKEFRLFEQACEEYLTTITPQKAEKSQSMDHSRIKNHLIPYFGRKLIGEIASEDSCILYKVHRETEGAARETIEKELWIFKGVINTALPDFKLLSFKSKKYGKWLKPKQRVVRYLEPGEFERVSGLCDDETHDVVMVARYTGLRLGDCVNLRWSQVDLFRSRIVIQPGKTINDDISVTVPIMSPLMEVLKRLNRFRQIGDERVFIIDPNEKAFKRRIQRGFKAACREAGLPDFRFHDLRHDFCSQLIQNGATLYQVADLVGHKSVGTTKRYAHLADRNRLEIMERAFKKVEQG